MSGVLDSVQRPGSEVNESAVGASALSKKRVWKAVGGTLCMIKCASFWDRFTMEWTKKEQLFWLNARLLRYWVSCSVRSAGRHF